MIVSSHGGGLSCGAPHSHCVVITGRDEDLKQVRSGQVRSDCGLETNLVIDWVPGHTVHRPHVSAEHCDGFVPLHVVNVDLEGDVVSRGVRFCV